jgi:carboxyl-terminal processing protease
LARWKDNGRSIAAAALLLLAGALLVLMEYPDRGYVFRQMAVAAAGEEPQGFALVEASKAVTILREHYAFQARLQPERMLLAAVQGIESRFDQVLVTPHVDLTDATLSSVDLPKTITIQVRDKSRQFTVRPTGDVYQLIWKLIEIFNHLAPDQDEQKKMEDAAIEGLLSVLDPHTNYMSEEEYREMKMSTRGSFGGLGIVISVREGNLRVISVMPDTPAARNGLHKWDHILRIEQESTVNMLVSEAANMLRGKPGTDVTLWIKRDEEETHQVVTLTREIIKVKSVLGQALDDNTAYLRVKNFQTNTADEAQRILDREFPESPPEGIVLDLRGNSGGVMSAATELADLFLEEGMIVATVAKTREGSESELAASGDRYENSAIVILVDHASASASEIVTSALKYRNRALVIGKRTFGKGSVQYIHPLDRGALKLTVSQYVGPNMEVIQGTGIQPHVELRAVYAGNGLRLPDFADDFEGEGALAHHLEKTGAVPVFDSPIDYQWYVPEDDDIDAVDRYGEVIIDLPIQFAWSVLSTQSRREADLMLTALHEALGSLRTYEESVLADLALTEGKQWQAADFEQEPQLEVTVESSSGTVAAGEKGDLSITAFNSGSNTVGHLIARTESTAYVFDERSCVIGLLQPGEEVTCTIPFQMPATSPHRKDQVFVDLYSGLGLPLATGSTAIETRASGLPRIAMSYRISDRSGNHDNWPQSGEELTLTIHLHNMGDAPLAKGLMTVKNLSGPALFVKEGRVDIADLTPGATENFTLILSAQDPPEDGLWKFELGVVDLTRRTHFSATQELAVDSSTDSPAAVNRYLEAAAGPVNVHIGPQAGALLMGEIMTGGGVPAVAMVDGWLKLQLPGGETGWVPEQSLVHSVAQELATFNEIWSIVEPEFNIVSGEAQELIGDSDNITIAGTIDFGEFHSPQECGAILYRNGKKVAMTWWGERTTGSKPLDFSFTTSLERGVNRLHVTAFQKNQSPGYIQVYYNRVH